jgi:hypothetical protein
MSSVPIDLTRIEVRTTTGGASVAVDLTREEIRMLTGGEAVPVDLTRIEIRTVVPATNLAPGGSQTTINYRYVTRPIRRVRQVAHFTAEQAWIFVNWLQVYMETGVGTANGDGSVPTITLQVSKDQGHTWSPGQTIEVGRIGDFLHRPIWRCLGRGRGWVFRIIYEAPTPCTFLDAFIDAVVGLSGF